MGRLQDARSSSHMWRRLGLPLDVFLISPLRPVTTVMATSSPSAPRRTIVASSTHAPSALSTNSVTEAPSVPSTPTTAHFSRAIPVAETTFASRSSM